MTHWLVRTAEIISTLTVFLIGLLCIWFVIRYIYRSILHLRKRVAQRKSGDGFIFRHTPYRNVPLAITYAAISVFFIAMYFKNDTVVNGSFIFILIIDAFLIYHAWRQIRLLSFVIEVFPTHLRIGDKLIQSPYEFWYEKKAAGGRTLSDVFLIYRDASGVTGVLSLERYDMKLYSDEIAEARRILSGAEVQVQLPQRVTIEKMIAELEPNLNSKQVRERVRDLYYIPLGVSVLGAIASLVVFSFNVAAMLGGIFAAVGLYTLISGELIAYGSVTKGTKARLFGLVFFAAGVVLLGLLASRQFT